MRRYEVDFFDGISSKKSHLILEFHEDYILFPDMDWIFNINEIKLSSKIEGVSQTLNLPNGGYCLLKKDDTLEFKSSLVKKLESKTSYAFISLLLIVGICVFMLTYGSSWSAKIIANTLPQSVSKTIGKEGLEFLEEHYLKPTNLPTLTQTYLQNAFKKIAPKGLHVKLHFYYSPILKENAFALPSGDIIMLDDLVLKDKDKKLRGIIGVLGHEIGHIKQKHTLQNITKTSIVGILSAYFIGDFSTIIATLSTGLITLSYSREFEIEADKEAVQTLKKHGYSLIPLIELFKSFDENISQNSLFSTHPMFKERIKFIQKSR